MFKLKVDGCVTDSVAYQNVITLQTKIQPQAKEAQLQILQPTIFYHQDRIQDMQRKGRINEARPQPKVFSLP